MQHAVAEGIPKASLRPSHVSHIAMTMTGAQGHISHQYRVGCQPATARSRSAAFLALPLWPPDHTLRLPRSACCAVLCCAYAAANHETAPAVVQFPSILRRGLKATYARRQAEKLQAFLEWVDKSGDAPYADISHMTSKSWADVALDWLLRDERYEVTFIILRRHLIYALRSFLLVDVWRPGSMLMYNGE